MVTIKDLFDLEHSLLGDWLGGFTYPWEALEGLADQIRQLGPTLDPEVYEQRADTVWVARSATIYPNVYITGPTIIGPDSEVRPGAFIRGSAMVGAHCVVGNSTELKNAILFDNVQVPHFNYVGDSILGYKAHMGAGSITSNVKSDKKMVSVCIGDRCFFTGRKKLGAMLGDGVEVGCNAVLNPGTVLGRRSSVYPTACVRGVIPADSIVKLAGEVIPRK